jgi:hypothetical protein
VFDLDRGIDRKTIAKYLAPGPCAHFRIDYTYLRIRFHTSSGKVDTIPEWGHAIRLARPCAESAGIAEEYWKRFISCLLRLNLQATFNARLSECTWP